MASKVRGVSANRRSIRKLPPALRDETGDAIAESAEDLHARGLETMDALGIGTSPVEAKVQNGKVYPRRQMRKQYRKSVSRKTLKGRVGYISKRARRLAFYVRFVHDGTVKLRARPFHDMATEAVEGAHDARIAAAYRRAFRVLG